MGFRFFSALTNPELTFAGVSQPEIEDISDDGDEDDEDDDEDDDEGDDEDDDYVEDDDAANPPFRCKRRKLRSQIWKKREF